MYGVYLGFNGTLSVLAARWPFAQRDVALPFLVRTEALLFPLLPLFIAYVFSLLGFNVAKQVLKVYFGY